MAVETFTFSVVDAEGNVSNSAPVTVTWTTGAAPYSDTYSDTY